MRTRARSLGGNAETKETMMLRTRAMDHVASLLWDTLVLDLEEKERM